MVFRRALRCDCPHSHSSLDVIEVNLDREVAVAMARILFVYRTSKIEPCVVTPCANPDARAALAE